MGAAVVATGVVLVDQVGDRTDAQATTTVAAANAAETGAMPTAVASAAPSATLAPAVAATADATAAAAPAQAAKPAFALQIQSASSGTAVTKVAAVGTSIGTLSLTPPAGARYVSPTGSDAASGTSTSPWKTLAKAVAATPSGGTVVMRAGTYRESVTWYGKRLTIQNYPGEKVWLSGSVPVSGWAADGATRWYVSNWKTTFPRATSGPFVDVKQNPYAGFPDMVFIDGVAQKQVGSKAAVTANTFFVDYATSRIYLGTNPAGKVVEAAKHSRAVYVNHGDGTILRGIGVQRYASLPDKPGAVFIEANDAKVENVVVRQNAAIGLSIIGLRSTVSSSSMIDNGQIGLHGNKADGLRVTSTLLQGNNVERFAAGHAQGGLKLTTSRDVVVRDGLVRWNHGRGLWFDIASYNIGVAGNVIVGNKDRGVMVEISAKAVIVGNVIASNGAEGIIVSESKDVDIYNNSLWMNGRAISVVENSRTSSNPTIPSNVDDVVIRNNLISSARAGTAQLVSTEDTTRSRSAAQLGVSFNYNAYHLTSSTSTDWLVGWANYPAAYGVFKNLATFTSKTGQEKSGSYRVAATNPFFVSPSTGDFTPKAATALYPKVALPANVAAVAGLTAGAVPAAGASF